MAKVAVPEDFLPGTYQLMLRCVPEIEGVLPAELTVVAAVDEPVAVTDANRPANYCRLASKGGRHRLPSRIPVPTELE